MWPVIIINKTPKKKRSFGICIFLFQFCSTMWMMRALLHAPASCIGAVTSNNKQVEEHRINITLYEFLSACSFHLFFCSHSLLERFCLVFVESLPFSSFNVFFFFLVCSFSHTRVYTIYHLILFQPKWGSIRLYFSFVFIAKVLS